MNKENKNPLLAGLINVLIPGSSEMYVNKNWGGFIAGLVSGMIFFLAAFWLGNRIQNSRGYSLPQGICMGGLMAAVVVTLFLIGYRTARIRNSRTNATAFYNSKRIVSHESDAAKHRKIREMRDEGLISKQEYDEKNAKVEDRKRK